MKAVYELRVVSYPGIVVGKPSNHTPAWFKRWAQYALCTDCEIEDWEDRANSEWSWR